MAAAGIPSPRLEIPREHIARDLYWHLHEGTPREAGDTFDAVAEAALLKDAVRAPATGEISRWAFLDDTIFSPVFADGDAVQVLLPGGTDSLPFDQEEQYVVFIPTSESVVMVPANEPQAIARAANFVEFFYDERKWLSFEPIIGSDGSWRTFDPPTDHPAHAACKRLGVVDRVALDTAQRRALAWVVDPAVEVSALQVVGSGSSLITICYWTEGIEALLPKADAISFWGSSDDHELLVDWDTATALVGERLLRLDHEPTRWLTMDYPTREELSALDQHRMRIPE